MARTHLGYKAEHVIDLESEIVLSATVYSGTDGDAQTLVRSVVNAQMNLIQSGSSTEIEEVVADTGYHANEALANCQQMDVRTYVPEPNSPYDRRWTDKPPEQQAAVVNNRRRMKREKGKRLQRERSEKVERSFAHICETGGARRTWLAGLEKINKRYLIVAAARNLGLLMLSLFGMGKPRTLQAVGDGFSFAILWFNALQTLVWRAWKPQGTMFTVFSTDGDRLAMNFRRRENFVAAPTFTAISTGC